MSTPVADAEDPTTQLAWPSRAFHNESVEPTDVPVLHDGFTSPSKSSSTSPAPGRKKNLTTWDFITLSISMAGAQIAWTVELGYGTPFLLSIGISEQLTSLVWLAGPISGLIAQPVIGAISDSSSSKYRRRYWIVLSTAVLVISTFVLAYCKEIAAFGVDLLQVGAGDWDEKRNKQVASTAIFLAVTAFYLLDFALNALQASLRNLLLDIAPSSQLNTGNAWHSRMTAAGNIVGYGFGFIPLAEFPIIRLIGGTQFRKFCVVCNIILIITVWITCWCHEEEEGHHRGKRNGKFKAVMDNIYLSIVTLPKPIRRVCYVQLFAFLGWFPFLFYATTYVGQIMGREMGREPDHDLAARTGERAMLVYSVVSVIAGAILPRFAARKRSPGGRRSGILFSVTNILLRNIWMCSLLLFTFLTSMTLFVNTVNQATVLVGLVGISWAVQMWAPFAIIMELLKEVKATPPPQPSTSALANEQQPLLDFIDEAIIEDVPLAGGTVLGVHNLAIVMPQFFVSLVTNIIFRVVDGDKDGDPTNHDAYFGKNGVAWVLRFGGMCTIIAAMLALMVPPTPTEKALRRSPRDTSDVEVAP